VADLVPFTNVRIQAVISGCLNVPPGKNVNSGEVIQRVER